MERIDAGQDFIAIVDFAHTPYALEQALKAARHLAAPGGRVIAVATEGDREITRHADETLFIPDAPECLSPMLAVIPLQLMAYYAAVIRGHDVDKPRNLAKSVTVE